MLFPGYSNVLSGLIRTTIVIAVCMTVLSVLPSIPAIAETTRSIDMTYAEGTTMQQEAAQGSKDMGALEQGKSIENEMKGGESHSYWVKLEADRFVHVIVDQRGIDVEVKIIGPDDKQLAEVDSPNGDKGPEPISIVADKAGNYRIEINSLEKDAPAGRYQVKIEELRTATEQDRAKILIAAEIEQSSQLNDEAEKLNTQNKYEEAIALYERALAIREKRLGPEASLTAEILDNMGVSYYLRGDNARAEELFNRALAIYEKIYGPEHRNVATELNNLAIVYDDRGDYARSEALNLRSLAMREKVLGPDHADVADSLNNLALVYFKRGDYVSAEPLYKRAVAIVEKKLGPEHPNMGTALDNLGGVYRRKGDYAKAIEIYQRALAIREKALGPKHPFVAISLNNLGGVYNLQGNYQQAGLLFERALAIYENALGLKHPYLATVLQNLASVSSARGDFAHAVSLALRGLSIREEALGPQHPEVVASLDALAMLYTMMGDATKALDYQSRANEVQERILTLILSLGSEAQKRRYMATVSGETDATVSLHQQLAPQNAEANRLALTTVLRRKGRVLDVMSDSVSALRRRLNKQDRVLLEQLSAARSQLTMLVLKGRGKTPLEEYQVAINKITAEVNRLETEVSARSAEFRVQTEPVTLEHVQQAIPQDSALVEFVSYRPFNAKAKLIDRWGAERYVAYVLRPQGEAEWVDLGPVADIDNEISRLRDALRDPGRNDTKRIARALDEKVMRPVRRVLGQSHKVLLSPDGALNLIPFSALLDERSRYLIERYSFTYLTSGRDLLRLKIQQPNRQGPVVIANPSFEQGLGDSNNKIDPSQEPAARRSIDFSSASFKPLPGTGAEALALSKLLPEVKVLTEGQATEVAVKQVTGPSIMHIATHGFFLADQQRDANSDPSAPRITLGSENPLLRSGLALAGANRVRDSSGEDGILTALEAAGLDLWGTKLVVLSACDTGIGEVKSGDGVYGLRRALVIAGAESQVMSLWQVSDTATRDLMVDYYKRLKAGEGRMEALRQAQLKMLHDPQRSHPFYWASFIPIGQWTKIK